MSDIKELIRQEIIRMHQEAVLASYGNDTDWLRSRIGTCVDILDFIDSLPEEKPSEDLEEAADKFEQEYFTDATIGEAFIAGAEWAIHYQEKKIADAYEKGKQEGIRIVRSWESSPGQGGY